MNQKLYQVWWETTNLYRWGTANCAGLMLLMMNRRDCKQIVMMMMLLYSYQDEPPCQTLTYTAIKSTWPRSAPRKEESLPVRCKRHTAAEMDCREKHTIFPSSAAASVSILMILKGPVMNKNRIMKREIHGDGAPLLLFDQCIPSQFLSLLPSSHNLLPVYFSS